MHRSFLQLCPIFLFFRNLRPYCSIILLFNLFLKHVTFSLLVLLLYLITFYPLHLLCVVIRFALLTMTLFICFTYSTLSILPLFLCVSSAWFCVSVNTTRTQRLAVHQSDTFMRSVRRLETRVAKLVVLNWRKRFRKIINIFSHYLMFCNNIRVKNYFVAAHVSIRYWCVCVCVLRVNGSSKQTGAHQKHISCTAYCWLISLLIPLLDSVRIVFILK